MSVLLKHKSLLDVKYLNCIIPWILITQFAAGVICRHFTIFLGVSMEASGVSIQRYYSKLVVAVVMFSGTVYLSLCKDKAF